jgi:predicted DNA-binding WGR domain protein
MQTNKREFALRNNQHQKYWAIQGWASGMGYTVHYGRIGAKGSIQPKPFNSAWEADQHYKKVIKEKINKGYIEQIPSRYSFEDLTPFEPMPAPPGYNGGQIPDPKWLTTYRSGQPPNTTPTGATAASQGVSTKRVIELED